MILIEFLNLSGTTMPLKAIESSFESQLRNYVIAKLFRLALLSENLGYRLRKLKRWQEVNSHLMQIETTINSVKVTFDLKTREIEKNNIGANVGVKLLNIQSRIIELN